MRIAFPNHSHFTTAVKQALTISLLLFCISLPWSLALMQITAALTAGFSLLLAFSEKRFPVLKHPFFIFPALYLITRLCSAALSPRPGISFVNVLQTDWVIFIFPLLAMALVETKRINRALSFLLISATVVGLYGCVQAFVGLDFIRDRQLDVLGNFYRATGGYGLHLTFAGNQLFAFCLAFAFFLTEKTRQQNKWAWLFAAMVILLSIIASFSRSAWLAFAVVIPLGALAVNKRLFGKTILILLGAGILAMLISPSIQDRFISSFDPSRNMGRLNLWKTSWAMIQDQPVWGIGPGLFNTFFPEYKVPGFYDAFGHSHNDYLNTAVNSGITGLITWMAVWIAWFYYVLKAYHRSWQDDASRKLLLGSLLGMTGIMIAALFQCYYTDLENNIFWWFIAALGMAVVIRWQGAAEINQSN